MGGMPEYWPCGMPVFEEQLVKNRWIKRLVAGACILPKGHENECSRHVYDLAALNPQIADLYFN